MSVNIWSQTAATNATVDSTINFREGQAASTVNNSARAMMAAIAKWRDDISGNLLTTGSSTAYAITSNQSLTPLVDGYFITARMHTTSGASPTLNVDATGAKAIRIYTSTAAPSGSLLGGSVQRFTYDSGDDCWYAQGYQQQTSTLDASGIKMLFIQTAAPTGWTKDTTHDNKALRIVSGTAGTGGSAAFTTALASRTPAGTVGDTTLTVNQIPLHGHPYRYSTSSTTPDGQGGFSMDLSGQTDTAAFTGTLSSTPGQQIGGTGGGASHTHSFTGTAMDFAVAYVDAIIATKT